MKIFLKLCSIAVFAVFSTTAQAEQISWKLKQSLKQGHLKTCVPTIHRQMTLGGFPRSDRRIKNYCGCLGLFYFNDFTKANFNYLKALEQLPPRKMRMRKRWQNHCWNAHLT